jgi:hypothetical protein
MVDGIGFVELTDGKLVIVLSGDVLDLQTVIGTGQIEGRDGVFVPSFGNCE